MTRIEDYVARIDGTCGKEKDVIVTFKYEKKDEAIRRILEKATMKRSIAGIIAELSYKNYSFRMYGSGKVILRGIENKEELNNLLRQLLL
jgi:TATA-box binding protein (TBP) (component of TFIID and TFIIIB)